MTAPGLEFPAGSMLWVYRALEFDRYGDPIVDPDTPPGAEIVDGYVRSHQIGPCSIVRSKAGRATERQSRTKNAVKVRCEDIDADLKAVDRIRLPGGSRNVQVVDGPYVPTNPFTGWRPSMRFEIEEVN